MFKKILCPMDGSDHARKALQVAVHLAKASDAKLVLLHALLSQAHSAELQRFAEVEGLVQTVQPEINRLTTLEGRLEYRYEEPPQPSRALVEVGQHVLDGAKLDAEQNGVADVSSILVSGDAAGNILRYVADEGVDCVVMGARGLSDVKSLVLGSVSHKVLNQASCVCVTVK